MYLAITWLCSKLFFGAPNSNSHTHMCEFHVTGTTRICDGKIIWSTTTCCPRALNNFYERVGVGLVRFGFWKPSSLSARSPINFYLFITLHLLLAQKLLSFFPCQSKIRKSLSKSKNEQALQRMTAFGAARLPARVCVSTGMLPVFTHFPSFMSGFWRLLLEYKFWMNFDKDCH